MATGRPLEGHFVVGGYGLHVHTDCLGRAFTSRTDSYDVTIGLPQLESSGGVVAPAWTYGPHDEREQAQEDEMFWGYAPFDEDDGTSWGAVIFRCRFYTTLDASEDEVFYESADGFLDELDDWRARFTSWVGILSSQDFVNLGGHTPSGTPDQPDQEAWTVDIHERRAHSHARTYLPPQNRNKWSSLGPIDLGACIIAAGRREPAPTEWLLIRDARSLLNSGQHRRAILDAGAAAELAMGVLVDKHLDDANTKDSVKQALRKRYRALEGNTDLLGQLEPGLVPKRIREQLIAPRNKASHSGASLNLEQAQNAISKAIEVVEHAYPLATLLPISTR